MAEAAGVKARLAWGSLAVSVLLSVTGLVLLSMTPSELVPEADEPAPLWGEVLLALAQFVIAIVGALVAVRRPEHPVGWLLCGVSVFNGIYFLGLGWARLTLIGDPGVLPAGELMAWTANLANDLQWPLLILTMLLFPDGRLPSPRWRVVFWVVVLVNAGELLDSAIQPGRLEGFAGIANPLGIGSLEALRDVDFDVFGNVALLVALYGLLVKRRRASAEERQQLKGFLFALSLVAISIALLSVIGVLVGSTETFDLVAGAVITVLVANFAMWLGVAVLKYRLYDIDVVINRTLVYAALTATVAAAYLAGVLLLQLALGPLTEDNDLAIAGSTLAAAALVRPARARIQAIVDRRFYRRRYDAARTLEGFGARLRDEVELDALSAELRAVVTDTMRPAHVSLWLREAPR
jgi:hypothetical protein